MKILLYSVVFALVSHFGQPTYHLVQWLTQ